ncbi:MAG: B12-binding domain-containing radical SAM protein [Omnitrophica bacterium]|nr:B12-binding domain-containing radical SAM protein [Candidatus Omnitrophota bacterium]
MNILLINPSQDRVYGKKMMPAYPALGLVYVGTVLKKEGHNVRLLDVDTEDIKEAEYRDIFKSFNPDAVGITSVTPTFKNAVKWGTLSKKIKNIPVVLGGIHATIAPEEVIKEGPIDIIVIGEGELTVVELFNCLSQGSAGLEAIKGIWFKRGNKIVSNERRPMIEDLDSLPFPDRTLLKKPYKFIPPDATKLPIASIITSRGCPGSCTFCCTKHIFSKRFRARSAHNISLEVKALVAEGIKEIHISDDTFTLVKPRVLDFVQAMKKEKFNVDFRFMNGLRADFVDKDILRACKEIGVKTVGYGVESGNKNVLKNIKKNISLDVTRNAFKISKELGFETWAFLIFGLPGDTKETIKETIRFVKELDPDSANKIL